MATETSTDNNGHYSWRDAHEERISDLEKSQGDLKVQFAEVNISLKNMSTTVNEKLTELNHSFTRFSDNLAASLHQLSDVVERNKNRIESLEKIDEKTEKRHEWLRETITKVLMGVLGAGGMYLFHKIVGLK